MEAMKSSCFCRQLFGFFGGSAFTEEELWDFGFTGFSWEMSVPSALCLLESNTFLLFLFVDVLQTLACLARTWGAKLLPQVLH